MNLVTITKENFDEIITANEMVAVDFWAEWCAPCRSFAEIYARVAKQNPDIIFGKVNTEEQPELAAEFNVRSIPMVMIMRRKVVLYSEAGLLPEAALQDLLDQAKALDIEKVCQELQHKE